MRISYTKKQGNMQSCINGKKYIVIGQVLPCNEGRQWAIQKQVFSLQVILNTFFYLFEGSLQDFVVLKLFPTTSIFIDIVLHSLFSFIVFISVQVLSTSNIRRAINSSKTCPRQANHYLQSQYLLTTSHSNFQFNLAYLHIFDKFSKYPNSNRFLKQRREPTSTHSSTIENGNILNKYIVEAMLKTKIISQCYNNQSHMDSEEMNDMQLSEHIREFIDFHSNNHNQVRLNQESLIEFQNSSPPSSKTNIPQNIKIVQEEISKEQRDDKKSKCFQQNLRSKCQTKTCKILTSELEDKKQSKRQARQVKERLNQFLNENKVKNNQLILFFISIFFRLNSAKAQHFEEMRKELHSYLSKRQKEAENETPLEEAKLKTKIAINREIIDKYFGPEYIQIDSQWIREVCGELFTGRQRETINKPIIRLQMLQAQLTQSIIQQSLIQSYFA